MQQKIIELDGDETVEIDQCPSCSGIWCDLGEYEAILAAGTIGRLELGVPPLNHDAQRARCPRCHNPSPLIHLHAGDTNVRIEKCTSCSGVWLDGGELEAIRESPPDRFLGALFRHN